MTLLLSATLLSLAAAGGMLMAFLHLRRIAVPLPFGLAHAGIALLGLLALVLVVWTQPRSLPVNAALLLFMLAAVGGVFNLLFRLRAERPPGFMIGLHGAVAATGVALLWVELLSGG